MKYFLSIIIFFSLTFATYAQDYLVDLGGKRKIIQTHKYSDYGFYRVFILDGTFTDNLGNYGSWESIVISKVENSILVQLVFSTVWTFQNGNSIYFEGFREDNDADAGVGKAVIIGADERLKSLINTKCTYSIKFMEDYVFGKQKCDFESNAYAILKNLNIE